MIHLLSDYSSIVYCIVKKSTLTTLDLIFKEAWDYLSENSKVNSNRKYFYNYRWII